MAEAVYTIFRFGFAVVFVGLHAALMAGLFLEWRRDRKALSGNLAAGNAEKGLPKVSVIIPVHNESRRMEETLRSLETQDYPNAEFIFIDDRSSDESAKMIAGFIKGRPSMRTISLTENPALNHKQYALARGIGVSTGEFLLFTDADCEIPPGWIGAMVKRMADERVGAAIGPVLKRPGARGFFYLYQCFEHGVRYMYLAASTGLGAAGGGFGNNMILRRASLEAVGGYEKVPPSPTEDAALVSRIRTCSRYKIRAALGPDVHVITRGEYTWKDFVNQTLRWNNGGLFSPDISTRINFGFLMITISMGILAIPFLPFIPSLWPLPAAVMLSMTWNTIAVLGLFGVSLPKKGPAYIIQLVFTPVYFTFLTIIGLCGVKPKWKGDRI
ncbi:MAG: glycosyltransferase [Treponema sp.]|jgi:cellulose synthase/poly-beta-1,6-N-acetylglucosamine synthase-like glycosyltransferase|nr:glycosyltransferase [Treponema sp.]